MTFAEAYKEMQAGKKCRRPGFKDYYYINAETGDFTICLVRYDKAKKVKTERPITYGQLTLFARNAAATDWEVVEEEAAQ